jgi:deoxyribodipyrimidine photo-lyase
MSTAIVWFRNDLRLHDHRALTAAIDNHDAVVCIYVVDDRMFGKTHFGFDRIASHRLRFLQQSLSDLDRSLREVGSSLNLIEGHPETVLPEAAAQLNAFEIYAHREFASEEMAIESRVAAALKASGKLLKVSSANTLYELGDLPFSVQQLPELFTDFRRKVEKQCEIPSPLPSPTSISAPEPAATSKLRCTNIQQLACFQSVSRDTDPRSQIKFAGGETAGLARITQYFWTDDCLKDYKQTRNGMLRANDSSKFSPWLATGCLSPRQIAQQVHRYEEQRTKNDSTYWMIFELLWRDYFAFITKKHGAAIFKRGGLRGRNFPWKQDWDLFDCWRNGTTGFPLIDANMRELTATGYMSNRGRQNVASFLTKNLGIDWRMGAQWFESMLVDYDPCSNYGNWNYSAGVGNDARGFRWFNTVKQAKQYDPDGSYVRHWIEELSDVPEEFIHTPWELNGPDRKRILPDYPEPIVDLFESANRNQAKFEAVRKT